MFLCLFKALVNAVLETSLRELRAELVAEKGIGGMARVRQKILLVIMLDHSKEPLRGERVQIEIIVVGDRIDFLAKACEFFIKEVRQFLGLLHRLNAQPFKVDVEHIVGLIVMQAFFQAQGRTLLEPHQRVVEDRGIHLVNGACNQWHKLHVRQDIPLKIDAGRNFH